MVYIRKNKSIGTGELDAVVMEILGKVSRPALVVDEDTIIKIGEYSDMKEYSEDLKMQYSLSGNNEIAEVIQLVELPHDQEEVDKAINLCGYFKKFTA